MPQEADTDTQQTRRKQDGNREGSKKNYNKKYTQAIADRRREMRRKKRGRSLAALLLSDGHSTVPHNRRPETESSTEYSYKKK